MKLPARIDVELRKGVEIVSVAVKERATYRGNFWGTFVTYALFIFIFSRIWRSAYATRTELAGYDLGMSIWYFIFAELSLFGFGRFAFSAAEDMKSGQIAYFLARPFDYVSYNAAYRLGPAFLETGLLSIYAILFGRLVTGYFAISTPIHGLCALLSLVLAAFCQFFFQFALAMTAFWVEENNAFFWIFQKVGLIAGTLLPLELLPSSWRKILAFTPFPSFTWAPARIAAAFSKSTGAEVASIILTQALWLALGLILCRAVFSAGRSKVIANGG